MYANEHLVLMHECPETYTTSNTTTDIYSTHQLFPIQLIQLRPCPS